LNIDPLGVKFEIIRLTVVRRTKHLEVRPLNLVFGPTSKFLATDDWKETRMSTKAEYTPLPVSQGTSGTRGGLVALQSQSPDDVVITLAIRSPLCKARKGGFKDTRCVS
jgi:hypothetical protein